MLVAITSNRGLCGAFNSNIIKKAKSLAESDYADTDVSFLTIGKKGSEFFTKTGFTVRSSHDSLYDELTFENTSAIAQDIMQNFLGGKFDKVILIYNQFKNAATQLVLAEQFLPIETPTEEGSAVGDYILEPSKEEIVTALIPKS